MLTITWAFAIVMSEITDHHNEHNGDEKVWHIERITKTWHRHEGSKCCWKNGTHCVSIQGCHKPAICLKKNQTVICETQ